MKRDEYTLEGYFEDFKDFKYIIIPDESAILLILILSNTKSYSRLCMDQAIESSWCCIINNKTVRDSNGKSIEYSLEDIIKDPGTADEIKKNIIYYSYILNNNSLKEIIALLEDLE